MRTLLYFDEYCYKYQNAYYVEEFCLILLGRYMPVYEELSLAVRVKEVDSSFFSESKIKYVKMDFPQVRIIEIPFGRGGKDYINNLIKIKRLLKSSIKDFDLAIIRIPSIYAFTVLHYVSKRKIPYAVEVVADSYDLCKSASSFMVKFAEYIMHKQQRKYCKNALGVAYVTKQYIQKHYPSGKNVSVISNYSSIELKSDWYTSNRNYPQNGSFKIIHVAYHVFLNSSKGHKELIDVLAQLKLEQLKPSIILVGNASTSDKNEIIAYARSQGVDSQITFAGFLGRSDLHSLLKEVDLAVLLTKSEGLPRVIIEAMAVGLPCVSTRVGGIPELLDDEFMLEMSDISGFAEAIKQLMCDKKLYEQTSLANFERSQLYEASALDKKRTMFYMELKNLISGKF